MDLKVLFIVSLCLLSVSIICNVTAVAPNVAEEWSQGIFSHTVHTRYLTTNGTEPTGDPIGGGNGWPN